MRTLHTVLLSVALLLATAARADDEKTLALGKTLFNTKAVPACAICHTLRDAGSTGEVGPVLDEIKPTALRVLTALKTGIGQMPAYANTLSDVEMKALALYVSKATGAEK